MKIKLSKEQISEIANEVVSAISRPRTDVVPRTDAVPRTVAVAVARIRQPGNEVVPPRLDTRRDDGVLLTVRADLAAVVQAIRNGSQKHALELSEHLLGHVEEVLAER